MDPSWQDGDVSSFDLEGPDFSVDNHPFPGKNFIVAIPMTAL